MSFSTDSEMAQNQTGSPDGNPQVSSTLSPVPGLTPGRAQITMRLGRT